MPSFVHSAIVSFQVGDDESRTTPPAVVAFQATPQGASDEQMQDLTLDLLSASGRGV